MKNKETTKARTLKLIIKRGANEAEAAEWVEDNFEMAFSSNKTGTPSWYADFISTVA
jgi:hypothetical protein